MWKCNVISLSSKDFLDPLSDTSYAEYIGKNYTIRFEIYNSQKNAIIIDIHLDDNVDVIKIPSKFELCYPKYNFTAEIRIINIIQSDAYTFNKFKLNKLILDFYPENFEPIIIKRKVNILYVNHYDIYNIENISFDGFNYPNYLIINKKLLITYKNFEFKIK